MCKLLLHLSLQSNLASAPISNSFKVEISNFQLVQSLPVFNGFGCICHNIKTLFFQVVGLSPQF